MYKEFTPVDDDKAYWMGLSTIFSSVRFHTNLVKANDRKAGWRVRCRIYWLGQYKLFSPQMIHCLEQVLPFPLKKEYTTKKEMEMWVLFINKLAVPDDAREWFSDQRGLHEFLWVMDNPPPHEYEKLQEWLEYLDDEMETFDSSVYKATSRSERYE